MRDAIFGSSDTAAAPDGQPLLTQREDHLMTDTTTVKPKPAKAAAPVIPLFEMPKFDIPSFALPKMEVPAAFREFAEKGVAQTKEAYEKFKAAAEQNTEMLETVYTTASKGTTEYGLKVIEAARANTDAMFEYVEALL